MGVIEKQLDGIRRIEEECGSVDPFNVIGDEQLFTESLNRRKEREKTEQEVERTNTLAVMALVACFSLHMILQAAFKIVERETAVDVTYGYQHHEIMRHVSAVKSGDELEYLAKEGWKVVRELVAKNPNTRPGTLAALAGDNARDVRREIAKNPNTPERALDDLAGDEVWMIRKEVAKNPNTGPGALTDLAGDDVWVVRGEIARNPRAPEAALIRMVKDRVWYIRAEVARHRKTPPSALVKLAGDPMPDIRREVARHRKTPSETLANLASDRAWEVRQIARSRINPSRGG